MRKAEERKWIFSKELFQEYAMDKIAILQCLRLEERNIIHCLIDRISSVALKATAAMLRSSMLDNFLEEMHHIASTCMPNLNKSPIFKNKFEKINHRNSR